MYMDENTSFRSVAGSLTSALINEEFSPIISEAIANQAFPFSPELKQLADNLYVLELFHGPSGIHKDFGISYLTACLEHILLMREKSALIVAPTSGETGASIARALKIKTRKSGFALPERNYARLRTSRLHMERGQRVSGRSGRQHFRLR